MKTMKNFLSMAALALVGAVMTGCSGDDNFVGGQQPENISNVVTLTTTVGFDGGAATTRALTETGVKTFAAGDQIAVIYKNTSDQTVTAVSNPLNGSGDIDGTGKNATFTVTLTNPKANQPVRYIYPSAMLATSVETSSAVNADANVKYSALDSQNGTLATLASTLDLAIFDGSLTAGAALPASATMTNRLSILAITLKDIDGSKEITSSTTGLTLSDGTNSYAVTRSAVAGPIYVAIRPTTDAHIWIYATTGTKKYIKSLKKTYEASNGYNVSWKMATVGDVILSDGITAKAGTAGALALITYVGNDAETNTTYNHGLALALMDASTTAAWCSQKGATCLAMHYSSSTDAWNDMAGIANTNALVDHTIHNHAAATAARNYNSGTPPKGTSAWFLPSAGQWYKMIDACKNVLGTNNNYTDLRDGFSTRGGTNLQSRDYWSSTEREIDLAHEIDFNNGVWGSIEKTPSEGYYVRACLAF